MNGLIPVAILTRGDFDATRVDALSVRFGPGQVAEAHGRGHVEDVDGDGRILSGQRLRDLAQLLRSDAGSLVSF